MGHVGHISPQGATGTGKGDLLKGEFIGPGICWGDRRWVDMKGDSFYPRLAIPFEWKDNMVLMLWPNLLQVFQQVTQVLAAADGRLMPKPAVDGNSHGTICLDLLQ